MSYNKTQVMYWTGTVYNDGTAGDSIPAIITEQFNQPLVDKATDYVLCVERFEINLNAVPYYDITLEEKFDITYFDTTGRAIVVDFSTFKTNIYSLLQLVDAINSVLLADTNASSNGMTLNLDAYGFIYFSWTGNVTQFVLTYTTNPSIIQQTLGFGTTSQYKAGVNGYYYSVYPRFDCSDNCEHIRIISNLNLVSDTAGQAKTNIVTDVANVDSFQTSTQGLPYSNNGITTFTFTQRQKLTYQPFVRRWLNFAGPTPISYLQITAEAVRGDNSSNIIYLPVGASFSIKLGFYSTQ